MEQVRARVAREQDGSGFALVGKRYNIIVYSTPHACFCFDRGGEA